MGFFKNFSTYEHPKPKTVLGMKPKPKGPGSIPKPKPKPMIGGPAGMRKMPSMRTGGMVTHTMPHMLHKGEMVLPAEHASLFKKLLKK